jgi:hypothetical protein
VPSEVSAVFPVAAFDVSEIRLCTAACSDARVELIDRDLIDVDLVLRDAHLLLRAFVVGGIVGAAPA